jgi:hypothetical protein
VHFVLADRIGHVRVVTDPPIEFVLQAASAALEELREAAGRKRAEPFPVAGGVKKP